jgi:hypothetical protein
MSVSLLASLEKVNWDDLPSLRDAAEKAFTSLTAERWSLLLDLLDALPANPALTEMCETYDFLDKLVLYNDAEAGYRVRLHVFQSGYFDRPHNHRWSFASMILTGSYLHTQFGADDDFESATMESLQPLHIRTERPGDWYALHHTAVHSVRAEAGTVSLVLRGPAAKDSFRIIDAPSGASFHVRGAKDESAAERAAKRSAPDRLAATIAKVKALRPAR